VGKIKQKDYNHKTWYEV